MQRIVRKIYCHEFSQNFHEVLDRAREVIIQ